jgi:uncharacterized protein YjlB
MDMKTATFLFDDDGDIPNHPRFGLIVYRSALDPLTSADPARAFEKLFHGNGWRHSWRNGIYSYHHYHSNAHEVLGIATGAAEVQFGGVRGKVLSVVAGDAVLIPAGVGHKSLSLSRDLLVVGAYPSGVPVDLMREGAIDRAGIGRRIAGLAKPVADPVAGPEGPMVRIWPD